LPEISFEGEDRMEVEAKKELYDILFRIGQQIFDHYNPCDWRNGKCRRMRLAKMVDKGCCEGCKHLGKKGCTVRSLDCTLWLCESQSNEFKECVAELKILRLVADYCGVPCEHRKSKEENFNIQPRRWRPWRDSNTRHTD
jgi:hypothetical protein